MTKPELQAAKKIAIKLVLFTALIFVIDRGLGNVIEKKYSHSPHGNVEVISHCLEKPEEDVMIFGSSRAVHGYNYKVLQDTLGMTVWNCGRESSLIPYHVNMLNWSLKKHVPKIVILDITPKEFTWRSEESLEKVLSYMTLPYVRRDTAFRNMANSMFPDLVMRAEISKLYAYNSLALPIMMGKDGTKIAKVEDIDHGYLPLVGAHVKFGLPVFSFDNSEIDTVSRAQFVRFLDLCLSHNIKLFVCQSPIYIQPFPDTKSDIEMKRICKERNVPFLDYVSDSAYLKQEYFYDNVHINVAGSVPFTQELASDIKKLLQKDGMVIPPGSATAVKQDTIPPTPAK